MLANYPAHIDEKVKESFDMFSTEAMDNSSINVLFNVNNSNDYSKGYTSIEGGSGVDYFGEGADLNDVDSKEGYNTVGVAAEFGWKIRVTKKEMLNESDETTLFNLVIKSKIPVLMSTMLNFVEEQTMTLYNNAFTTALSPDAVSIINATHVYNSTWTTFSNRHATNIVAGTAALTALEAWAGAFVDANGKPMPVSPKTLLVKKGGSASVAFRQQLATNADLVATTVGNVNIYNNGDYTLIESPFLTSDTAWFAYDSRAENPLVVDFVQRPTLEARQTRENLTQVTPASGSFRFLCAHLPTTIYGSDGSGS